MAKKNQQPQTIQPSSLDQPHKRKTFSAFRLEKITQYEWQAFKITLLDDGTFIEEKWDRLTLPELLGRRMMQFMGREAHEAFEKEKRAKIEAERAKQKNDVQNV